MPKDSLQTERNSQTQSTAFAAFERTQPERKPAFEPNAKMNSTIANAELTGFMDMYNVNGINHILDYHLFIRCGDKVYMDVRGKGDIVLSFEALQKNKYWKYYYDVSIMLTNDKHSVINHIADVQYTEPRFWAINTAYIEGCYISKTKKVKNEGYTCYYKINPFDVENMEYALPQDLDAYTRTYMERFEVRGRLFEFDKRSVYYYTFVFDYCVRLMENELDELSEIFEDKKSLVKLLTLNEMKIINYDVLMIIYDSLVKSDCVGKNKFVDILMNPNAVAAQIVDM